MAHGAKRIIIVVLLALATLLWTVGGVSIWVNRQALDTQNWVDTSDALLRDETIRVALSNALLDRLYASAPVERRLREQLPPELRGVSGPVAAAVREAARRRVPELLGSDAALTAWEAANRAAHKTLIKLVDGDLAPGGEVSLNVDALLRQVAQGTGLSPDVVDRLPPEYRQLQILRSDQLETSQDAVHVMKSLPWILIPLATVLFLAAIFLAADRRRAVVWGGACAILSGVAILAIRRLGGDAAVDALAESASVRPATKATLLIGTSLLTDVAWGSILIGALVAIGAALLGPARWATSLRGDAAPTFRDRPAAFPIALAVALLLLVIWGPVPWTRNLIWIAVVAIAAFAWLVALRNRTLDEFPDAESGATLRRLRSLRSRSHESAPAATAYDGYLARLERLADLRERGVLDEAEYQREKQAALESMR